MTRATKRTRLSVEIGRTRIWPAWRWRNWEWNTNLSAARCIGIGVFIERDWGYW